MTRPMALVSIWRGIVDVQVYRPGAAIEVRDYDIECHGINPSALWTDEAGERCIREFIGSPAHSEAGKELEQFVEDLDHHADVRGTFEKRAELEYLHVIRIGPSEFYFEPDGMYRGCKYFPSR